MSMLAEKKVKEKWCQDPRNTLWSSDKSKYGYRMLQRMGWEEGKGLGSKEEGLKEHIRVKVKRDNRGLGERKCRDEAWIEHQDAFDEILANLNAQTASSNTSQCPDETVGDPPQTTKTLLETATESKRLLYKKVLKSKDLSEQSSEDLDCVLGRKRRKLSLAAEKSLCVADGQSKVSTSNAAINGITTVTSHQSVQDYFSTKLSATKKTQSASAETNKVSLAHSEICQKGEKRKVKKRIRKKLATS